MSMRYMSVFGALVLGLILFVDAAPYQELEPREGYVPVYIREGDTPLLEINPKLAEAFNEIDTKNLLEQVDTVSELENKPDLILMSIDNDGDAMLIAKPADQIMSENEPAEVVLLVPTPASEAEEELRDASLSPLNPINEDTDNVEKGQAPEVDTTNSDSEQLEEAKEVMKELVNVLEEEILKKLSLEVTEKPVVDDEKNVDAMEEDEINQPKLQEDVANDSQDDDTEDDDKITEEPATDVLTVDAFKTKEIDVKSVETEKIYVPEEETAEDTTLSSQDE